MDITTNAKTFKNDNGKIYRIAAVSKEGNYTFLIDDTKDVVSPYVIAWLCKEGTGSWAQGHYYLTFEMAYKAWEEEYKDK